MTCFAVTSNDDVEDIVIPFGEYDVARNDDEGMRLNAEITKQRQSASSYFILRYRILESPQMAQIAVSYDSEQYAVTAVTQHTFNTLYAGTDIVICGKLEGKNKENTNTNTVEHAVNAVLTFNGNRKIIFVMKSRD